MNQILDALYKLAKRTGENRPPIAGITSHPSVFHQLEEYNLYDESFLGERTQLIPHFSVWNQPCLVVKWTSYEVMMRYVRRKDVQR